ncbi:DUF393 domain-containing protein [Nocardia sp. NBC_01503]|uniref:hypothetical protein n=1 Tax=Nocardia sp. NBC_01503 TaxID=2975997 RepID=UPI002E7ADB52|nr:hypothetical protein [Nocardia sp. NBC_01503]WTL31454.1 DUF393 domain-containing protein [Nocardia sp. NBC_01503]
MTESAFTPQSARRPLVVFDGDCAFCTASVDFIRHRIGPDVDFTPWQRIDLPALGLTEQQVEPRFSGLVMTAAEPQVPAPAHCSCVVRPSRGVQ